MHIAIISDIHGNRLALDAVLADIQRHPVDQILCLGDVAASGPQPRECVERLRELDCAIVRGNADDWLLAPNYADDPDDFTRFIEDLDTWCAQQLTPADLDFLRSFQPVVEIPLGGGETLLGFHGSPRANTDVIVATTPDDELHAMLADRHARVMAGGHTHQQMFRRYRETILLNPGSVGLPYERDRKHGEAYNVGWAEYAWVHGADGDLRVELRRVPVDVQALIDVARRSGMPHAERWVRDWSS